MYAEERHQAIAELVASRGRVAVTELATHFDVTTETVRRDLSQLEKLKLLRRVHGGAVSMRSVTMLEAQLPDRDQAQAGEKERIARAAVAPAPRGRLHAAARRRQHHRPAGRPAARRASTGR